MYLGGSRFGARAYADNFTTEELVSCIHYAHLWGRKVYLTVNTLVKEYEFAELYDYILPFYEAGLDGVIVQDIGVFVHIRDHFPGMELHVSTQMTLTGEAGARLLRDMGACRIVPARELSLKEIRHIKEKTGLSIETFIHGAMCYCYSGQCLFSSILGGRSGNRGRCAQPCRLPYEVETKKGKTGECYPLSLKDMCTIEHLPQLMEAGIDSFKIEGRMKKPEYTAGVTAIYRKYIDRYREACHPDKSPDGKKAVWKVEEKDLHDLSCLYIRSERQDGYYYKHNGRDMVSLDDPAYSGSDEKLLAEIRRKYLEKKPRMPVAIYGSFLVGDKASVTLILDDLSVTVEGDVVQTAAKQPVTKENIEKQLDRLGDTSFAASDTEITVSGNAFYPLRGINELRRQAVALMEKALIEKNGFPVTRKGAVSPQKNDRKEAVRHPAESGGRIFVSVRTMEQLRAIADFFEKPGAFPDPKGSLRDPDAASGIERIYLDSNLFAGDCRELLCLCSELSKAASLVVALPYILREKDHTSVEELLFFLLQKNSKIFSGVLVRSLEGMGILLDSGYQGSIYTDAGFYVWNRQTVDTWADTIAGFCLPLELKAAEQKSLLSDVPCEKVVYGRIPMMITANCVANTTSGCRKGSGEHYVQLTDRYRKKFPVELDCIHCMNIIYNSVPLSLHGELAKWQGLADFRLDFTLESGSQTREITDYFLRLKQAGYDSAAARPPYRDYTTGHEKRGVE